ncbi:MAG: type II toxin-antitoxin system RelE family toxin [Tangfeifania sp.]
MYKVILNKKVIKFLQKRSDSEKKLIKRKIELLQQNPIKNENLDIKQLKGVENVYRLRIGKIRMVYQVMNDKLIVILFSAGMRGDVYKRK